MTHDNLDLPPLPVSEPLPQAEVCRVRAATADAQTGEGTMRLWKFLTHLWASIRLTHAVKTVAADIRAANRLVARMEGITERIRGGLCWRCEAAADAEFDQLRAEAEDLIKRAKRKLRIK